MNIKKLITSDPKAILLGCLLFLLPFTTLLNKGGVSFCSFAFLLLSVFLLRDRGRTVMRAMTPHLNEIRWVLIAFLLNFLYVLANLLLRSHEILSTLEKPSRMLFAVSALACVLVVKPSRKWLWWGLMTGVFAGAVFIVYQRVAMGLDRPGGLMNAITFGDLALCMGLLCLAAVIDYRGSRQIIWPCLGVLAGLIGSIATGTRGGWVALIVAAVVFLRYSHFMRGRAIAAIAAAGTALLLLTYCVPQTGVQARVAQGVADIHQYADGSAVNTNLGLRFELWKGAAALIRQHPLLGNGIISYKDGMLAEVEAKRLSPLVLPREHIHNDALQVLVTGGIVGFVIWLATLIAPLRFFLRVLKSHDTAGKEEIALALAGLLLVLCYASFGLTEVIFWSVKASLFYILMLYALMGLCLNATDARRAAAVPARP